MKQKLTRGQTCLNENTGSIVANILVADIKYNTYFKLTNSTTMKRINLLLLLLFFAMFHSFGQSLIVNDSMITVDATNSRYRLFPQPGDTSTSAVQDTSKRTKIWLETGTGFYLTMPPPSSGFPVGGSLKHQPFMLATNLYDTTKDDVPQPLRPSRLNSDNNHQLSPGINSLAPVYYFKRSNSGVKIVPNAYDIVRGDTMAFAITYKTPTYNTDKGNTEPPTYKLYFFYNNNQTFEEVVDPNKNMRTGTTNSIPQCRVHNNESPVIPTGSLPGSLSKFNTLKSVCFNIPGNAVTTGNEKNVFITMVPLSNLETGKSGSVYAVLTDANGNVIQSDSIANMRFGPAHDPNFLVQLPFCLLPPKKVFPFDYTIHFQNTGVGDANRVKVLVHLPKGLDYSTYHLKSIVYAGVRLNVSPTIDKDNNTLLFDFNTGVPLLNGTANVVSMVNVERTMGEIQFTINSTPNTDLEMKAWASIYFKSVHPSNDTVASSDPLFAGFEQPVQTNTAVTKYSEDCACRDCTPLCHKILGLCWWWWLIILVALLIIIWLIIKRRNKKDKVPTSNYN